MRRAIIAATLLAAALFLLPEPLSAQTADTAEPGQVRHRLSFPDYRLQYVEVQSEYPVSAEETLLLMPSWTPGAYLIRDFAANVDRLEVKTPHGRALPAEKVSKDAWRVDTGDAERIIARYSVHCSELSVSTSWVSPELVLLNGASVFLYTEESRHLPQRVSIASDPPTGQVMTPLPPAGEMTWQAAGYDELVDNPIVIGAGRLSRFETDRQDYILAQVGDASLWDVSQAARDVERVVAATNELWRTLPFERTYWIINLLVERGGGLEHDHGSVLMSSRWQMRDRKDYVTWLSLVSHEYFHAWNVRRMRPRALGSYDYRNEQYSRQLWLAEGITSYYDDLLLSRARVIRPAEYLDRLANNIHTLELTPGRKALSLQESSHDTWIRHYQPDANSINTDISYYTKGAVVGFVLDARLREESRDRSNLDEVLRAMYADWGDTPYPEGAFLVAVERAGGGGLRDWLEPLITTPRDPDVDEALDWYGLVLDRDPQGTALRKAGLPERAGFGINWSEQRGELVVGAVVHGLSAARAGILPGDELLAINDERVTRGNLEDRKDRLRPGERVEFLLSRNGRILRVPVELGKARPARYEIKLQAGFGARDQRRLERWLGQSLETAD